MRDWVNSTGNFATHRSSRPRPAGKTASRVARGRETVLTRHKCSRSHRSDVTRVADPPTAVVTWHRDRNACCRVRLRTCNRHRNANQQSL
jgi:hypothetical protein